MREWKPGDVAMATFDHGGTGLVFRVIGAPSDWCDMAGVCAPAGQIKSVRPLVVIDPDDREQVERLVRSFVDALPDYDPCTVGRQHDVMQTALREFANPAPLRIPEPGLWGVVEATVDGIPRRRWVHHEEDRWVCDTGERRYWDDLADPELIREGVQ